MSEDIKDFFICCDAEAAVSDVHSDYQAYLECETVYHDSMPNAFLSLFTKRDGKGKEVLGTEVWLDIDSVQNLIAELSTWAMNNGASLADIADLVGLSLVQDNDSVDQEYTIGYDECPFCGSENIQDEGQVIWCGDCSNTIFEE